MTKKIIEIGDRFGTWEVIGMEENDRKYNYNYICKCDCGNKRMIRKDKLVNFSFPLCNKCNSNNLIKQKWDLIKSMWDENINGKLVFSELDIRKRYLWKCPEGHMYYDTIMNLTGNCPTCWNIQNKEVILSKNRESFQYAVNFISRICEQLCKDTIVTVLDADLMVAKVEVNNYIILIIPNCHNGYNSILHSDKKDYFDKMSQIKKYKNEVIFDKREHIFLELTLDTNIDSIKIQNILKKFIFK